MSSRIPSATASGEAIGGTTHDEEEEAHDLDDALARVQRTGLTDPERAGADDSRTAVFAAL